MATQKVGYFITGTVPNDIEQAEIDWLNENSVGAYAHAVRSVLHNTGYGSTDEGQESTPEHFDLVASNGADIPEAYAGIEKFTVPIDPQRSGKKKATNDDDEPKKKSTATWPKDDEPTKRGHK